MKNDDAEVAKLIEENAQLKRERDAEHNRESRRSWLRNFWKDVEKAQFYAWLSKVPGLTVEGVVEEGDEAKPKTMTMVVACGDRRVEGDDLEGTQNTIRSWPGSMLSAWEDSVLAASEKAEDPDLLWSLEEDAFEEWERAGCPKPPHLRRAS